MAVSDNCMVPAKVKATLVSMYDLITTKEPVKLAEVRLTLTLIQNSIQKIITV